MERMREVRETVGRRFGERFGEQFGSGGLRPLSPIEWVCWSALAFTIAVVGVPLHAALYEVFVPMAFVLAFVQGGSVLLAVLRPVWGAVAHVVAVVGVAGAASAWGGPWPMPVIGMIAFAAALVAVALRGRWVLGVATWVAAMLALTGAIVWAALVRAPSGGSPFVASPFAGVRADAPTLDPPVLDAAALNAAVADLVVAASVTALALAVATVVAKLIDARLEVRVAREQTETQRAHVRWEQERARIAREMHDVVAHSMSIVHMRATSARYRLPGLEADAVAEFDGIAEQARGALREMRGLLGVLREGDGVLEAPQPTFAELDALIDSTRAAGVEIEVSIADGLLSATEASLPASVQLALYRVAQESLSNAVRHAPGAAVFVGLEPVNDELWLTVENGPAAIGGAADGAPGDAALADAELADSALADAGWANAGLADAAGAGEAPWAGGGHGIRGMMERMASVGGSLNHRPLPGGGFRVVARVPRGAV